jgi:hypothetical protein
MPRRNSGDQNLRIAIAKNGKARRRIASAGCTIFRQVGLSGFTIWMRKMTPSNAFPTISLFPPGKCLMAY